MKKLTEKSIEEFYTTVGWMTDDNISEDARRFEDLRSCAEEYVSKCRLRVLRYIPKYGENILDMASGSIQYKEYLEYSRNFKKRYCIDISSQALEEAKKKIGNHGVFLCGNFFDIDLEEDFFDCTISLHTVYHIHQDKQEKVVRKLIYVTKPGKNVIIVYSNPYALINLWKVPFRFIKRNFVPLLMKIIKKKENVCFYVFIYPNKWWYRFSDVADVKIVPWRSFISFHQKILFPNNKVGKKLFSLLYKLEERFPNFFVKYFQYPMIILTKK